jgi:FHA domain-containing protein/double zinc ribbon protein
MLFQCPQGHSSATSDFCDVCGEPITGATTPPAEGDPSLPPDPDPAPSSSRSSLSLDEPTVIAPPLECPNCGDVNLPDALFCEVCGYDFTTGQLPSAAPAPPAPAPAPAALAGAEWVAEIWVDPDWFAAQEAAGTCATSGAPTVVPLPGTSALIGRRSESRNIVPQIDCSADGSVSHRHADLTLDHDRWYIEDLGSTNGTYVGVPGDPLPTTPLTPHERHELADGERIYIGAWCRVMIRRATDDEKIKTH